ncbi:hypothetical protein HY640_04590 [Candidatus Woesearchaeota archaeon]|nr:hypothetical protein [Candidatus Woesearchaeota archaeon]
MSDETQTTTLRMVLTVPLILLLIWFFVWATSSNSQNQADTINTLIGAAENAKDHEAFVRSINIKDHNLYGFNTGEKEISLVNGKSVEKPSQPACSTGACICLCKQDCKKDEETYCKPVKGIDKINALTNINGANNGIRTTEGYRVAIDGTKQAVICIEATRSKETLAMYECGATVEG